MGDRARVQVFEESGAWRENVSLVGLSATEQVTALAVNSAGDMLVNDGNAPEGEGRAVGVPGVHEFEPDGVEVATQFDAGSTTIDGLALDGSGDLFVGDSSGGFHVLMYGPAGNRLASFGANTVIRTTTGMAFSEALGELYVPNSFIDVQTLRRSGRVGFAGAGGGSTDDRSGWCGRGPGSSGGCVIARGVQSGWL